jgi:two-component system, chemotaxis family, CheB/CheR fusion protein
MVENQRAVRSTSKKRLASRRLAAKAEPRASSERPAVAFPIVGVGASAGGLEAFRELLRTLPTDTGMAFVLVQLLAKTTALSVREVANNVAVKPNHVYVIPRNTSLSITRGVLHLQTRELTRGIHRPIDLFFESLAQDQHENAIGVILSGTATDGTLGLEAVKAEGGITFAQDESAKYDSMPRSAIAAGCVDFVLKPEDIAKELARIAKHPVVVGPPSVFVASPEDDRASTTAHEDDETPLPSGGHGIPPRTGATRARRRPSSPSQSRRQWLQKNSSPPPQS